MQMMQIKNKQVSMIVMALRELTQMPVPVKTAMKIRKLARQIDQQAADMEALRLQLIERYAKRGGGEEKIIKADQTVDVEPEFFTQIDKLMELEFEADPMTMADLVGVGNITAATLINLGDLLLDDEVQQP